MKKQKGFTLMEVVFVIGFVASITLVGTLLYVAAHFISKFW